VAIGHVAEERQRLPEVRRRPGGVAFLRREGPRVVQDDGDAARIVRPRRDRQRLLVAPARRRPVSGGAGGAG
jgi:hypothetical protein